MAVLVGTLESQTMHLALATLSSLEAEAFWLLVDLDLAPPAIVGLFQDGRRSRVLSLLDNYL